MRVTEHLERATETLFSYEIIPPPRGKSVRDVIDVVEQLVPLQPPFIDVTSHMAEAVYEEQPDGSIIRRVRKKRPGTLSICGIIQNRYGIDTVPHLLCSGFTREETEDAVIELVYLGIQNCLAIRGDVTNYEKPLHSGRSSNLHAVDLVRQLSSLRRGRYLEDIANSEPIDMCIGVGGYPEKHCEAPNMKVDVANLKAKVDAGADYVVTQMFFDNSRFFEFEARCRAAGITVPIIPGLKLVQRTHHLTSLPRNFQTSIPEDLADDILENPAHVREIGLRWGQRQCRELLERGVPCLHFYVMNDAAAVAELVRSLR
ncbi:MAG: methylenetetrahydrofolate reductase [Candidatus Krumholzibacteriia bacterium]